MKSDLLSGGRQLLEAKNNGIFIKSSAQKVVAVANERWLLTRGSNYSDLIGKLLLFGKVSLKYWRWIRLSSRGPLSQLHNPVANILTNIEVFWIISVF